jgi:integrase
MGGYASKRELARWERRMREESDCGCGPNVIRNQFGERYTSDGFRAMWQRFMRQFAKDGNERFTFHDLRAKSISDNPSLQAASSLAGHIDMKVTNRVYDRGVRSVEPLR